MSKVFLAVVLTTVVVAGASWGATNYWARSGQTYSCQGLQAFFICRSTTFTPRYEVSIDATGVTVSFKGRVVFFCKTRYFPSSCLDFR